jgi:hypothetical protein
VIRLALVLALLATPAQACHRFRVWKYPYPQRCSVAADRSWFVEIAPQPPPKPEQSVDIPLPPLDQWVDPPDATGELGERLKGIGLLRQLLGTN